MWSFLERHLEEALGGFMLAVMVSVAFANVVVRYCTPFSFAWSEEITVNFFVWIVLLGTAREFREGGHLCMGIVYSHCPRKLQFIFHILGMLVCLGFFAALAWTGTLEIFDEMDLDATSESLGVPVWVYTVSTPLLSLLVAARIIQHLVSSVRRRCY